MGSFVVDLWHFLRARGKIWLVPVFVVMVVLGVLLVVAQGSAVGPFLYTFF